MRDNTDKKDLTAINHARIERVVAGTRTFMQADALGFELHKKPKSSACWLVFPSVLFCSGHSMCQFVDKGLLPLLATDPLINIHRNACIIDTSVYPKNLDHVWTGPSDLNDHGVVSRQPIGKVLHLWDDDRVGLELGTSLDELHPGSKWTNWELQHWHTIVGTIKRRTSQHLLEKHSYSGALEIHQDLEMKLAGFVKLLGWCQHCGPTPTAALTVDVMTGAMCGECDSCYQTAQIQDTDIQGLLEDWCQVAKEEDFGFAKVFTGLHGDDLVIMDASGEQTAAWDQRSLLWVPRTKKLRRDEDCGVSTSTNRHD